MRATICSFFSGLLSATKSVSVVKLAGVIFRPPRTLVLRKKPDKRKRARAFVAVNKWMIFYHEIKQMRRLFFCSRIHLFATK